MKKIRKIQKRRNSNDVTVSPDAMIDGQLIRSGLIRLLNPSVFEEIFEIKPDQVYLDKALDQLAHYSDDDLFDYWIKMIYIENNISIDQYTIQMYALEDIAWSLYLLEYNRDHPELWVSSLVEFDTRKKNWFKWY